MEGGRTGRREFAETSIVRLQTVPVFYTRVGDVKPVFASNQGIPCRRGSVFAGLRRYFGDVGFRQQAISQSDRGPVV